MLSRTQSTSLCQWLLVIGVLVSGSLSQDQPPLIKKEKDTRVTIDCDIGQPITTCNWAGPNLQKAYGLLYTDKNTAGYSVDAVAESGKCTLVIESAKVEDDGTWECDTFDTVTTPFNKRTKLMVVAFPRNSLEYEDKPITGLVEHVRTDENGDVLVNCVSVGGLPPPTDFQFIVDEMEVPREPGDLKTENERTVATVKLNFPQANNNGAGFYSRDEVNPHKEKERQVKCVVRQQAYDNDVSPAIMATVGLEYETDFAVLKRDPENSNNVTCQANGIPAPTLEIEKKDSTGEGWTKVYTGSSYEVNDPGVYRCVAKYGDSFRRTESKPLDLTEETTKGDDEKSASGDSTSTADTGAIVGIVVGALVLLALIGGITMFTFKKKKLCFSGADRHEQGQGSAENGVQRPAKPEEKRMVSDKKEASQDAVIHHN